MKLGYVIAYVEDVAKTLQFYGTAFGLKPRFEHPSGDYAELDTGGTALAFAAHTVGESNLPSGYARLTDLERPAGLEIALVTDNVEQAVTNAVGAGATLLAEPSVKPWGQTVAYVRAPDGLLIELCTPVGG